jgi:hypothetical protein
MAVTAPSDMRRTNSSCLGSGLNKAATQPGARFFDGIKDAARTFNVRRTRATPAPRAQGLDGNVELSRYLIFVRVTLENEATCLAHIHPPQKRWWMLNYTRKRSNAFSQFRGENYF